MKPTKRERAAIIAACAAKLAAATTPAVETLTASPTVPPVAVPVNMPVPADVATTPAAPTVPLLPVSLSAGNAPCAAPTADGATTPPAAPTTPRRRTLSAYAADVARTPLSPTEISTLESLGLDSRTLTASGRVAVAVGSSPTITAKMRRDGRAAYPTSVALIYRDGTPVPRPDLPPVHNLFAHARTVLSAVIENRGFTRDFDAPVDHMIACRYGDSDSHAGNGHSPIDRYDFATEYARRVMIAAGRRDADSIITPGRSRSAVMHTRAVETLALLDAAITALPANIAPNGSTPPTVRHS